MKRIRKVARITSVIAAAILTALVVTILCTPEEDRIALTEALGSLSDQEAPGRQIDWDSLPAEIVAWVEVPGTGIDEPIVQATPDSPNAYLHKDALGQGNYGTPYIDCECSIDSRFVMVYGHHMSDGSAFADFARFSNPDYADDHPMIYVHTRDDGKRHEFRIKAVDVVDANDELVRTSFECGEDCIAYIGKVIDESDLVFDRASLENERVWGFVTCSYQTRNSRTVVYASAWD